ncbi:MAG: bifunctional 4-hydroxy-3-methylbut-2-enyl diphosphate reductase/30S ribosomal protein S1 [Eubacteriales bacterium]
MCRTSIKIITASHAGFCFGVKRAVDIVYALAGKGRQRIFTMGKLIHNPHIVGELERRGVTVIAEDDLERVFSETCESNPAIVVIRTHGVTNAVSERLKNYALRNPFFSVRDCTCPNVKRIHSIVAENSDADTLTIIIGDKKHPEVCGISSYAAGEVAVCSGAGELGELMNKPGISCGRKLLMVSQTTQDLTEWKNCQENIQKDCTNAFIFDTICSVTEIRQQEAYDLSQNVDIMLVIGGRESSNTNKLYNIAAQNTERTRSGRKTFLVESEKELPLDLLMPHKGTCSAPITVGITAGASTPSSIIEEVINLMKENRNTMAETGEGAEDFAGMLENSLKTLNTGETVQGIITSITPGEIHVDLKAKVTGIIPYAEISDNQSIKLDEIYHVGDEIEAIVVKVSDLDGVATLSRKRIENVINWRRIVDAYNKGTILEGKFVDVVKGGIIMLLDGVRIFVPASHSGLNKDGELSSLVGTVAKARIIEINEQRRRAVASVRAVMREDRKSKETEFWASIEEGKQYVGVVKSLTTYGAFVDLGGVDGMVHSSELSWKRIRHPSEVVSVGDKITVYVKSFDPEARRISLGYKTDETNPWAMFTSKYQIGDVAPVKIVSMMPFGAFAEVVPGADGLIHISQIADKKINKPADILEIGQVVDAKIIDIDMENRKISLSIRALIEEAAAGAEDYKDDGSNEN